jgi:hypothetical protein
VRKKLVSLENWDYKSITSQKTLHPAGNSEMVFHINQTTSALIMDNSDKRNVGRRS